MSKSAVKALQRPFTFDGRIDRLAVLLFALVNGLVLLNAVLHNPVVGYDAEHHLI